MNATTTQYTIRSYTTGEAIGDIELTAEQYAAYEAAAQQPEGIVRRSELPGETGSETVYLD